MMTANFHHVRNVQISDIYPNNPGRAINVQFTDDKGNTVTVFMDDVTLRKLPEALQRYAATREAPPITPRPSYAETLFAPLPSTTVSGDDLPF